MADAEWRTRSDVLDRFPDYGAEGCVCGSVATPDPTCPLHFAIAEMERMEGATQRHLFEAIQTGVRWRAALRRAVWRIGDAHRKLSPGMRAGTAEAKALLSVALDEAKKNEREIDPAGVSERG